MRYAYPLMLDVVDRPILIVGGGAVAARKAGGLLRAGARRVQAIALQFSVDFPAGIARMTAPYDASALTGMTLVFAATDQPRVNEAVVRDARSRHILVCRADNDDDDPGDFATPAILRRGPISVCVSGGGSPALSANLRDVLDRAFDDRWEKLADMILLLRPRIRSSPGLGPTQRAEIFRRLASPDALVRVDAGIEPLVDWLSHDYPELKHA